MCTEVLDYLIKVEQGLSFKKVNRDFHAIITRHMIMHKLHTLTVMIAQFQLHSGKN